MRSIKEKFKYNFLYPIGRFISSAYFFKPYFSSKDKLSVQPFFILGSGRNGSTLLASSLNQYTNIHIPPEQFVLPYSIMKFRLLNFLSFKKLTSIILNDFKKIRNTTNWKFHNFNFDNNISSFQSILDSIYRSSSKDQFLIWGDKTPQNTFFIKYIYPIYPKSKYIFIIRDGRDVISSLIKMMRFNKKYEQWTDKKMINQAVKLWNSSIDAYDYLLKQEANIKLIKYEDFTLKPSLIINDLISFLDIDSGVLEDINKSESMGVKEMQHHQNLAKPISTVSIGKWKSDLKPDVLNQILPQIQHNLDRFNY